MRRWLPPLTFLLLSLPLVVLQWMFFFPPFYAFSFFFMPERRAASLFADLFNDRDLRLMLRTIEADAGD